MSFPHACRAADKKQRKPVDPRLKKLRRLLADDISLDRAWHDLNRPHGVPIATLLAAEFLLQQRDPERLRTWLEKHSMQRAEILRHLKERRRARGK
jgi:hypothetical protein